MLRSVLIGLVAGQRGLLPLAIMAGAARNGALANDAPGAQLLARPLVATGAVAMAAAEMAGDKMKTAPDRTILPGLLTRAATAAYAGAALATKEQRTRAALAASAAAVASSFLGLHLRRRAMSRWGQTRTGVAEDALLLGSGLAITQIRR